MGKGGGILRAEWGMAEKNRLTKIGKACIEMRFLELKDGLGILMVLQLALVIVKDRRGEDT